MILMRHGDCFPDYENDPGLSPAGWGRLRACSYRLLPYRIEAVLHSDKQRTLQTVAALQARLSGLPAEVHPTLREIHPHALDDATHADARRAAAAFARLVEPHLGRPVLLVAHRNLLHYFGRRLGLSHSFDQFADHVAI